MLCFQRRLVLILLLLHATVASAQKTRFNLHTLHLPKEIADRDNQFSGLYTYHTQLLLLSESRLQEQAEAKVYGIDLPSIDRQLADTSQALTFRKYAIRNLDKIRTQLDEACQVYEGLEGLTLVGDTAYFTVETATPSTYCYLLKGTLHEAEGTIVLDTNYMVPLPKPALTDGSHIHNAGFEAATGYNKSLLLLFEYNYFTHDNYALRIPNASRLPDIPQNVPVARLPFRLTDLVYEGKNRFTAINYFYNGADDSVYRPTPTDPNARFVLQDGKYQNYCRLISLHYKGDKISWKPLFELPQEYMTYNWEGLAPYHGGYFLMNDKYGPSGRSTLLYLQRK